MWGDPKLIGKPSAFLQEWSVSSTICNRSNRGKNREKVEGFSYTLQTPKTCSHFQNLWYFYCFLLLKGLGFSWCCFPTSLQNLSGRPGGEGQRTVRDLESGGFNGELRTTWSSSTGTARRGEFIWYVRVSKAEKLSPGLNVSDSWNVIFPGTSMSNRWSCITKKGFGYLPSSRAHGSNNTHLSMASQAGVLRSLVQRAAPPCPQPTPQAADILRKWLLTQGTGEMLL